MHTGPWERLVTIVLSEVEVLPEAPEEAIAASSFGPEPMDKESVVLG
ncbi:MAG TPA: hypothetical protein VFO11_11160 [Candidatus Polarisedimenticolaceae bacterium]|nr:hypothetical protein [Candidatus Polarisedimenticolaceae bacterium]